MDAHLPRPRWSEEGLGLPTGQGNLTFLRTGEGGRGELEGIERKEAGQEVEIFKK